MIKKLFILLIATCPFWAQAQTNSIELDFENLETYSGDLYVAIYDKSEDFLDSKNIFINRIVDVEKQTFPMVFTEVPEGKYCVSVYHDKNENGKLDFNFIGMPQENYGFSKNVFHRFWPPSFEECAFYLDSDKNFVINLNR